jgi:hypothetical protein
MSADRRTPDSSGAGPHRRTDSASAPRKSEVITAAPRTATEKGTLMTRFTRRFALPVLSAGILGAAALGLAGTASAGMTINDDGSMVATPDTYAQPWPGYNYGPYGYGYYYWP